MCFTCFARNYKRIFYMFFSVAVFFVYSLTSFCCSLSLFQFIWILFFSLSLLLNLYGFR